MILHPFGQTGMEVSVIGLGTVKLGRDEGVKYPESFTIPDDRQASELLALARDLGINLIDTAPAYGNSEERLGPLLKGQRNQWLICTKTGEEFVNGRSTYNFTAEHTRTSIERSLQRLHTDVLDIVLVHSNGDDMDIINHHGTLEALADLKQQGKIRAFGMSTKTVAGGLAAAQHSDAVMVTLNLQEQAESEVVDYCQQQKKGCLIKKALASGHACQAGEDPVQASMDFIFSHAGVSSVIVGTINPLHLKQNVQAALQGLKHG
jgi:aryl-alcohol dehydrogenase-like predicted oxidoreductase